MTEYNATVEPRPSFAAMLEPGAVIPAPQPGWSLELQRTPTHLQVRGVREGETRPWGDVVALIDLAGAAGAVPVFAVVDGALAYRFGDSGPWGQLLTIASFKGESRELPSFVASSTVGVVGSVPTVATEEVDGEVRFKIVLPPPRDGVSPPPLSLSVTSSEVGQGQPMTASLSGSYPNLTLALGLRAGSPGTQGGVGPQGRIRHAERGPRRHGHAERGRHRQPRKHLPGHFGHERGVALDQEDRHRQHRLARREREHRRSAARSPDRMEWALGDPARE
ncbi:hypothetical protein [Pseudoclavibacter sp. RFBA6]|uniref:hypothetical protein n=1 Tax=Pseudoclavibacter sp. RFBA6 TaxID=2080573 RepID=UPI0011B07662|nr:hypothetical protein [Pseudoclavibacter sp. RFBA6]